MIEYPRYKKILFCTDFSENADYAFGFAYGIAKKEKGFLYILHITPADPHKAFAESFMDGEDLEKIQKAIRDDLNKKFEEKYIKKIENSIEFNIVKRTGREAEEIINFAREENVDVIVMGTHGKTGIEHAFFGSIAEKVLRRSSFPVFIIPGKKES